MSHQKGGEASKETPLDDRIRQSAHRQADTGGATGTGSRRLKDQSRQHRDRRHFHQGRPCAEPSIGQKMNERGSRGEEQTECAEPQS